MKEFRYKTILLFGSLQFCGNIVEYFSENTEKLVVYYIMPRRGREPNMASYYRKGKLIEKKEFFSPTNFFLCYLFLYINFLRILFTYFRKSEKFYVICGHPLFSFFKSVLKAFRNYEIVFFVGDYYPGNDILNVIYRKLAHHYHDTCRYRAYLSDRLNKKFNGKILHTKNVKTIMWAIAPPRLTKKDPERSIELCFIGAIRESHGLTKVFQILAKKKDVKVKILGVCDSSLFKKYKRLIDKLRIEKQVYFPNKFIVDLESETADSHIGVALYTPNEGTYYADPGKVKAYAQLGLPILMTDAAQVADFIRKFKAGEIVTQKTDSILEGIEKMQKNYSLYQEGLKKFTKHFSYKTYYARRFTFLEG